MILSSIMQEITTMELDFQGFQTAGVRRLNKYFEIMPILDPANAKKKKNAS